MFVRYFLSLVFLFFPIWGCGSSNSFSDAVWQPEQPLSGGASGSVVLKTFLQEETGVLGQQVQTFVDSVVPIEVTHFRLSGADSEGNVVWGPIVVTKRETTLVDQVPVEVINFRIELLTNEDFVLGAVSQPIVIRANEEVEVNSPSYVFVALVGERGPTGPQGPAGADGATGPQGLAGADGATGPQGPTGADGAIG